MKEKLYSLEQKKEKAIIVGVAFNDNHASFSDELEELESLCFTAGLQVEASLSQNVKEENPRTLIGTGKVEEIKNLVETTKADVVIIDCELSGSQIVNISDMTGAKVIDRSMLILDIFAKRATSNEGRLQVKLAQLKYTLPRLGSLSTNSNRYGGGVGMRGPGETKLELNKRKVRDEISKLEKEIEKIKNQRNIKTGERKKNRLKQVAIVGYTNAGKSTLMNRLTKADIYADDLLFATLDTTSRKLWLGGNKTVVLVDTVGFIDKLPHAFIDAFNATLCETVDADVLLHVIDASDARCFEKIKVVEKVLEEIGVIDKKIIRVYNKIDKITDLSKFNDGVLVSAKENKGIESLKEKISKELFNE